MIRSANFYHYEKGKGVYLGLNKAVIDDAAKLEIIRPNTQEASAEKHIPVGEYKDGKMYVRMGSQQHPMSDDHYIEWVFVQTTSGGMYVQLRPGDEPEAVFTVDMADVVGVLAYCNLHGLWSAPSRT